MRTWATRWFGGMRVRILAAMLTLLLLSSIVSVFLLQAALLRQLDSEIEDSLSREAEEFRLLSGGTNPRTGEPFAGDLTAVFDVYFSREVADEGEALLAFVDGELYDSRRAQGAAAPDQIPETVEYWQSLVEPEVGSIDTLAGRARYVALPLRGAGVEGLFVVANFPANEQEEIQDALQAQVATSLGTLVVAAVVGALLAGRVLRPLVRLAHTAQHISESDLSRRIPVRGNDEASQIAITFNDMLGRLQDVFEQQRRFMDDTAHELRTPLTVIRGNLELLDLAEDANERQATIGVVLDEVDRVSRMVDDLFLLARSQQPGFVTPEPIDVADLARFMRRQLVALSVDVVVHVPAGTTVIGDRQRLWQAVLQLVANSQRHAGPGAWCRVEIGVDGGRVVLAVVDNGVGVSTHEAPRIFDRSARGARGSDGGAGLGLAIVRAIAEAHGGTARLTPGSTTGARFEIVLPPAPQQ